MTDGVAVKTAEEQVVGAGEEPGGETVSGQVGVTRSGEVVDAARQNDAVPVTAQRDVSELSDDELSVTGKPYDEYIRELTEGDIFQHEDETGPVYHDVELSQDYRVEFHDGVRVHVYKRIHHYLPTRAQYREEKETILKASGYTWEELDRQAKNRDGKGCFGFDSEEAWKTWSKVHRCYENAHE